MKIDIFNDVKGTFEAESESLIKVSENLDASVSGFIEDLYNCPGNIVFTGIGKSGHICKKIVSTMQSLGIKALYLHPAEGVHGDLGVLSKKDIVIAVSNSGETKEVLDLIPSISAIGCRLFCIVGRGGSTLESQSEKKIVLKGAEEVYLDHMVPTSSTTVTLVLGDAIAVALAKMNGFTKENYGIYHPNGQLGKKLTLKVKDIMVKSNENSVVLSGSTVEQTVFEMCRKPVGGVSIVDKNGKLLGIFTDGDLRRYLNKNDGNLTEKTIDDLMIRNPIVLHPEQLVHDAIVNTVSKHTVSVFPVVDNHGQSIGTLRMVDVIKSGLLS